MSLLDYLCETLLLEKSEIIKFALSSPHRYKVYKINKRNSKGTRTIAHPSKELKFIQRILMDYLQEILPVHEAAFAYRNGLGVKDNALMHLNSKYLLKMDFKDFFPSITPELFFKFTRKIKLDIDDADELILKNLLFCKLRRNSHLRLSIGAPSSPLISNSIMYFFDADLSEYCQSEHVTYTRYADDLTFSTSKVNNLFEMPKIVTNIRNKNSLGQIGINTSKTIFTSKGHNRHVTGVTLTNNGVLSIGRGRKRLISSMIYRFSKNLLDDDSILKLRGFLSFAVHIEPEFELRMKKKYGEETLMNIRKYRSSDSLE